MAADLTAMVEPIAATPIQVDYGLDQIQAQLVNAAAAPTLVLDSADDPNGDGIVISASVKLTGTAAAGSRVSLDIRGDGRFERSTTADADGKFSFQVRLRPGVNRFVAAVRTNGNGANAEGGASASALERSETLTIRRLGRLAHGGRVEEIASGLNSPRSLQVGPDGRLYVAAAGTGGNLAFIPGPDGRPVGLGNTASVIRLGRPGEPNRAILSGLPSLATAEGGEALGANGLAIVSRTEAFVLLGLGTNPQDRVNILNEPRLGQLLGFDPRSGGNVRSIADIAGLEQAGNFDQGEVDSNPFSVIRYRDGFAVVDAGANVLHILNAQGQAIETIVFPRQLTPLPNNPAVSIPAQPVPTTVAEGPDGALYVGQLTGFPFAVGSARIFRVVPGSGNPPEVFQTGFTHILRIAFAANGDLLVLQFSDASLLAGNPSGSLIRVKPNGERMVITNQLVNPSGLAVGPDGSIYVADNGSIVGGGRILRIGPGRNR